MKSVSGIAESAVAAPLCRGVRKVVRQLPDLISMVGWMFLLVCAGRAPATKLALTAAAAPALLRVYPSGGDVGVWIGIFEACVRKPVNP